MGRKEIMVSLLSGGIAIGAAMIGAGLDAPELMIAGGAVVTASVLGFFWMLIVHKAATVASPPAQTSQSAVEVNGDGNVVAVNASNSVVAHTVNLAPAPREMTGEIRAELLASIGRGQEIMIEAMPDHEAQTFANMIRNMLLAEGFSVTPVVTAMPSPPFRPGHQVLGNVILVGPRA